MSHARLRKVLPVTAAVILLSAQPARAGRTVIDGSSTITLSGYCSPQTAAQGNCSAYAMPQITLGSTNYNSFYVNSNGTVSLGSIEPFLAAEQLNPSTPPQSSLSAYAPTPIFSPNFADGAGFFDFFGSQGYDGKLVAQTSTGATGFTVNWFSCGDPLHCGQVTLDLLKNVTFDPSKVGQFGLIDTIIGASSLSGGTPEENFNSGLQNLRNVSIFSMTLTELAAGFQVDYSYNSAASLRTGTYGFSLPGAQLQETGQLRDRTFVFDETGALVSAVPEPSTWAFLLLGFGLAGAALRRQRRLAATA